MSEAVQAAIRRLRRIHRYGGDEYAMDVYKPEHGGIHIQVESDEVEVVRAYLATVAADDGAVNAIDAIRDAVLHERHQLAEMNAGPDIINAVLGIIDDHDPRILTQPGDGNG